MKLVAIIEHGECRDDACKSAQQWADACNWPVHFRFNSVACIANPGGSAAALAENQSKAQCKIILVRSNELEMVLIDDEERDA